VLRLICVPFSIFVGFAFYFVFTQSGAGDSSDDNALFELPDVSDLEKKRLSREAARNKKAEAEKSDKDESKRIARKVSRKKGGVSGGVGR